MRYGFAIIKKRHDEWDWDNIYYSIKKVRLFRTKSECNNGIKLEKARRKKLRGEENYSDYFIETFITK